MRYFVIVVLLAIIGCVAAQQAPDPGPVKPQPTPFFPQVPLTQPVTTAPIIVNRYQAVQWENRLYMFDTANGGLYQLMNDYKGFAWYKVCNGDKR